MESRSAIALATAEGYWEFDDDAPLLIDALETLGADVTPARWDDPSLDWSGFDLVVIRSTWDYPTRLDEFLDWAERVEAVSTLANPAGVIRWNTDKRYLDELSTRGLPVVPTRFLSATSDGPSEAMAAIEMDGQVVVKPTVSIGARDTGRFPPSRRSDAAALVMDLLAAGRDVMVQPYLDAVDDVGEIGLVYFDGEFSHSFAKAALLSVDGEDTFGLANFALEAITPATPSIDQRAVGDAVIDELTVRYGTLLYARVDLIPDSDGRPNLLELELTEPSFFLPHAPGSAGRAAEPDLRVQAATREGGLGWFATHMELLPVVGGGGAPQWLRVSGVFLRREGEWRLLEIHLSKAEAPAPARADSAARADNTDAAATARDSSPPPPGPAGAAAPPAGG